MYCGHEEICQDCSVIRCEWNTLLECEVLFIRIPSERKSIFLLNPSTSSWQIPLPAIVALCMKERLARHIS